MARWLQRLNDTWCRWSSSRRFPPVEIIRHNVLDNSRRGQIVDRQACSYPSADVGGADLDQWSGDQVVPESGKLWPQQFPVDGNFGAGHNEEIGLPQQRGRLVPFWQVIEHVGTDQPMHLVPAAAAQFANRIDGVAEPGARQFQVQNIENDIGSQSYLGGLTGQPAHRQAVRSVSQVRLPGFVGRLRRGDQRHPRKPFRFGGRPGTDQVPMMNWIETSAQAQRFHVSRPVFLASSRKRWHGILRSSTMRTDSSICAAK